MEHHRNPFCLAIDNRIRHLRTQLKVCICYGRVVRTSIFFMNRKALRSPNSRPTVKLWKLCDFSYLRAAERSSSNCSVPTLHFRLRRRSSSGVAAGPADSQKGCALCSDTEDGAPMEEA